MKRILLACILSASPVYAADAPKTPPLYTVALTAQQMQVIVRGLILAAGTCGTSDEACQIGLQKTTIIQAMTTALQAGQEKGK